jgi:hypothetical protein
MDPSQLMDLDDMAILEEISHEYGLAAAAPSRSLASSDVATTGTPPPSVFGLAPPAGAGECSTHCAALLCCRSCFLKACNCPAEACNATRPYSSDGKLVGQQCGMGAEQPASVS